MAHKGIFLGSGIVKQNAQNPARISRWRWTFGREPPLKRQTPFPKNSPVCLCVFWALSTAYFRLRNVASVPWAGLAGQVLGRSWPQATCERTSNRSQIAGAGGPGNLGSVFDPFALKLQPNHAQNHAKKPGPGTGNTIEQPKIRFHKFFETAPIKRASSGFRKRGVQHKGVLPR